MKCSICGGELPARVPGSKLVSPVHPSCVAARSGVQPEPTARTAATAPAKKKRAKKKAVK